jgi:hypothetical protein
LNVFNMKLYKTTNKRYATFYVLKAFLDKNDMFFQCERSAMSIEIVAEENPSNTIGREIAYLIPPKDRNPGGFPEGSLAAHLKASDDDGK